MQFPKRRIKVNRAIDLKQISILIQNKLVVNSNLQCNDLISVQTI